jgi:hypothetical protein
MDHQGALFDMVQDGEQRHDVSEKFPEETIKLSQAVAKWSREVLKDYRKTKRPFTVGHPDFAITQLPARDAKPQVKSNVRIDSPMIHISRMDHH